MASFKRCPRGLEVQTLLFPRDVDWTASRARAWAREHGFSSSKVDTTTQYFRVRNRNPNAFVRGSFRTIVLSEKDDVNAVVGCPLPGRESDRRKTARSQTTRDQTGKYAHVGSVSGRTPRERRSARTERYLNHFFEAQSHRPGGPSYRREMAAAQDVWREMNEDERQAAVRYMREETR